MNKLMSSNNSIEHLLMQLMFTAEWLLDLQSKLPAKHLQRPVLHVPVLHSQ
jgi:hypothetical protein